MDRLSQELIENILDYLPRQDVKNARLVQRRFRVHGACILFRAVAVDSEQHLNAIVNDEHLEPLVKSLRHYLWSDWCHYSGDSESEAKIFLERIENAFTKLSNLQTLICILGTPSLSIIACQLRKVTALHYYNLNTFVPHEMEITSSETFQALARLTSLSLHFSISHFGFVNFFVERPHLDLVTKRFLPRVLEHLSKLSFLSLSLLRTTSKETLKFRVGFCDVFVHRKVFPNLRDLQLFGLHTALNELEDYLRDHRDTMRNLSLGAIGIGLVGQQDTAWAKLTTFVREEMSLHSFEDDWNGIQADAL